MRQIVPHRNNIAMHRTKCKSHFDAAGAGTPQATDPGRAEGLSIRNVVGVVILYNHTKQCFMKAA